MDEEWLDHVLGEEGGVELVVTAHGDDPVALIGCTWHPDGGQHVVTDLAVDPGRRRSGWGRAALAVALAAADHPPSVGWAAFVDPDNDPALAFFDHCGWRRAGLSDGMLRFVTIPGSVVG